MRFISVWILAAIALSAIAVAADRVTLNNDTTIEGVVMKATDSTIFIRKDHTIMTLPRTFVQKIERDKADSNAVTTDTQKRLQHWGQCLDVFAQQNWVNELRDIPATVIDKGVLKSVPYLSYRCGDYEMNIYGDPEDPACVEIGVYHDLATNEAARRNCMATIRGMLCQAKDRALLDLLDLKEDKIVRDGWTFEVTPPTAEDAYGGWWISVYSEDMLDKARASDREMDAITVERPVKIKPSPQPVQPLTPKAATWSPPTNNWNDDDLSRARAAVSSSSSSGISSGGRVYVRGYYRKDGTYVQPHTRKR